MTYATQQTLIDRYGEAMLVALSDRGVESTGTIDPVVVARALADADAVIDGYLAGRYALPLASTPTLLTDVAMIVAIWKLHTHDPDPKISKDYDTALKQLRDMGTGALRIPAAGIEPPSSGGSGARITDRERPLTAENLKGFI